MKILGRCLLLLVAAAWMLFQLGTACQAQPRESISVKFGVGAEEITVVFQRCHPTPSPVLTGNPENNENLKKAQDELKDAEEAADVAKKAADEKPENEELEKEKNDTQQAADEAATKVQDLMEGLVPYESTNGFFLSETELSQEQYAAILGDHRLEEIHDRIEELTPSELFDAEFKPLLENQKYPVFSVSLTEAIEICRKVELSKNDQQQDAANGTIRYRVRLPSHFEWQYACRAAAVSSRPHFYQWQSYEDVKGTMVEVTEGNSLTLENLCDQVWKESVQKKEGIPFVGSQEQVLEIIKTLDPISDPNKRHLKILSVFLQGEKGIGLEGDLSSPNQPQQIKIVSVEGNPITGSANSWGLCHMNTNLKEWVLLSSHPENISSEWSTLTAAVSGEKPTADQLAALKEFKIGIAGGGSGSWGLWKPYTVWYVKDLPFDAKMYSKSKKEQNSIGYNNRAGIRLLMETVLADTWLISVRTITFREGANVQNDFTKARKTILDFAPASEKTQVLSRLDFYRALAYLKNGENNKARAEFKKTEVILAGEDPYFRFLQKAIDAESP